MKIQSMKFYRRLDKRGCIETLVRLSHTSELFKHQTLATANQNPSDIENKYIGQKTAIQNLCKLHIKEFQLAIQDYFDIHHPDPCAVPKGFVFRKFNKLFEESAKEIIRQEGYCDDINCPDCPLLVDGDCFISHLKHIDGLQTFTNYAKEYIIQYNKKKAKWDKKKKPQKYIVSFMGTDVELSKESYLNLLAGIKEMKKIKGC